MNREEFLENLQEVLQCDDAFKIDATLADIEEWDSLSMMSVLVFFSKACGIKIEFLAVKNSKTVEDLYNLMKG